MEKPTYQRVLLKISGEALAGEKHFGLDFQVLGQVADVIKECVNMGVQIGVVIGRRQLLAGREGTARSHRAHPCDDMGMLATAMNCMALADVLEQKGVDVRLQTALEIREVAEPISGPERPGIWEKAGGWRCLAAGVGCPFFSHRYGGGAAGGGDQRRRDPAGQEHRRRVRLRPGQERRRREVRRHHL